jgi:hypothetical protein
VAATDAVSAAVEEVSASAEEMSAQVEEVTASAQSLAEMAEALQQVVAQFKLSRGQSPQPASAEPAFEPPIQKRSSDRRDGKGLRSESVTILQEG